MSKPKPKPEPKPKGRDGRPEHERIRWTVEWAAREFAINPRTLSNRLAQLSIDADEDGYYSTRKMAAAYAGGDLESERIRETRSKADLNEIEIRKLNGDLVDKADLIRQWQPKFVEILRIIKSSSLTEDEQIKIQTQLEEVLIK